MTKTTYSEEEIRQILHVLTLEKKKNKELAAKVENQIEENLRLAKKNAMAVDISEDSDTQKLKLLIGTFKKKYDVAVKHLELKDQQIAVLNQAAELKTSLEEENEALTEQFASLKIALKKSQNELATLQQKKALEGKALEDSNREQEHQLSLLQDKLKKKEQEYSKLLERFEESDALRVTFEQQNLHLIRQVHDLEHYKELTIAAHQRIEELEKLRLDTIETDCELRDEEKTALLEQLELLKIRFQTTQNDFFKSREEHGNTLEKLKASEMQRLELEHRIQELLTAQQAESLREQLLQAESTIRELEQTLEQTKEGKARDKHRIEKLGGQLLEKDQRINDLQQIELSLKRATEQRQQLEYALEDAQSNSQKLLKEMQQLEEEKADSRQHSEQLERVVQFLRERSEEARLETKQLQEEYQKAQETIKLLTNKLEEAETAQKAVSAQLVSSEKNHMEAKEEIKGLQQQFSDLKNKIHLLKTELEAASSAKEEIGQRYEKVHAQNEHLQEELRKRSQSLEDLEKETLLIKQSLVRGLREAKEIEAAFQETVKDKVATAAKLLQSQHYIDKQREQIHLLQEKLDASSVSVYAADARIEHLQKLLEDEQTKAVQRGENHLAELDQCNSLIKAKDEELEGFIQQINKLKSMRDSFEKEGERLRQETKEKETELGHAQQHLAKKVKETAVLEEKYEEQKHLIQDLQQSLTQNKIKVAELQTSLDLQQQQQGQLQEQLQETIKAGEFSQAKWEEKYFNVYEKWQMSETRVKELEKIEEKQKHLQGMLANLGSYFGTNSATTTPESTQVVPKTDFKTPAVEEESIKPVPEKPRDPKPYQSLFNMPKPPARPRQNFLE